MRTLARDMLFAVVAMLAVAGVSEAQQKIWPPPGQHGGFPIPQLGFCSYFNGYGEYVTWVQPGTRAWQIGLERRDVIIAVNGYRLNYARAWWHAMARAAAEGYATLAIRDWRTGMIAYRHVDLGGPYPTWKEPAAAP